MTLQGVDGAEIGETFGIHRERVRQLLERIKSGKRNGPTRREEVAA
jgi:hypothetical protein